MAQKPKRSGAGSLSERVVFCEPNMTPDGYGGEQQGWIDKFTEPARLRPLNGGEGVVAGRLQGTQPYICTIRLSTRTRAITSAWRARNARGGTQYAIKTVTNTDERNAYLDLLIVADDAG